MEKHLTMVTSGKVQDHSPMMAVRFDAQVQRCETEPDTRCAGDQDRGDLPSGSDMPTQVDRFHSRETGTCARGH
jgi:hypothetical protein